MFKGKPDEWHTLPATKKGLMMTPRTKETCERHMPPQTPPPPEPQRGEVRRTRHSKVSCKAKACKAEDCKGCHGRSGKEQCGARYVIGATKALFQSAHTSVAGTLLLSQFKHNEYSTRRRTFKTA